MSEKEDRRDSWGAAFPERRTGDSRRGAPRAQVRLLARAAGRSDAGDLAVSELSVSGLYLETRLGLLDGDPVEFDLLVPGSDVPVRVAGVVRFGAGDPEGLHGQGIRFDQLDSSDARVVEAYLDRLSRGR